MSLREYVITLHNHNDLDTFYKDMETQGGPIYIPYRPVPCHERQPLSRNTTYLLNDSEADRIRRDSRVLGVTLSAKEQGLIFTPAWTQTSTSWNKGSTVNNAHRNWGLLRTVEGAPRSGWGSNATTDASGTINVTASGKHVDVVIVDGHINPNHPEFAVNSDGSGGSRVNQINWFTYAATVGDTANIGGTYTYTPYVDPSYPDSNGDGYSDRTVDNDHGCHVAGTVAGNLQGWARDANIYNINPYSTNPNYTSYFLQYIKAWHQSKPINPVTGIRNPTVTNHSYGISVGVSVSSISQVRYQGVIQSGPFSQSILQAYGIYNNGITAYLPYRYLPIETDFIDLINAGVIVIGAAGNDYTAIYNYNASSSDDYNNYVLDSFSNFYYYHRGSITAADNVICVGALAATLLETKQNFSNCGPRVDLYAPGRFIMSSHNSNVFGTAVTDARNSSYYITKKSGTSMASPQVCGIAACLAETWPTLKQSNFITFLQQNMKSNQIVDTAGGTSDLTALQGSPNRLLYFYKKRQDNGQVGPVQNYGNRPSGGQVFPRTKIFRYGT